MFSFKDAPNMYQSALYKRYVLRVMENFEKATNNISDLDNLKDFKFPKCTKENKDLGVTSTMSEKV